MKATIILLISFVLTGCYKNSFESCVDYWTNFIKHTYFEDDEPMSKSDHDFVRIESYKVVAQQCKLDK